MLIAVYIAVSIAYYAAGRLLATFPAGAWTDMSTSAGLIESFLLILLSGALGVYVGKLLAKGPASIRTSLALIHACLLGATSFVLFGKGLDAETPPLLLLFTPPITIAVCSGISMIINRRPVLLLDTPIEEER